MDLLLELTNLIKAFSGQDQDDIQYLIGLLDED